MRLSPLQKFIVLQCLSRRGSRMDRAGLVRYYGDRKKPDRNLQTKIITRSIESLIDKELLTGYGVRTPHKWFIREIKLTKKGMRQGKKLIGEQMQLPFKK
ncbi:MAG: hypothetical protein V1928_04360 [Parcubacteria group bacterium]